MTTFYPRVQLSTFSMEDFRNKIMGKSFICELKDKSFNCIVKNIIPAQPENLPFSIVVKIDNGQSKEISIPDIERLTSVS